ncbi:hypothetical protein ABPG75_005029 [Micractinium tetrahymenae]
MAAAAAAQGHFLGIPGFSEGRIAWLKTNFMWMMYRSGWASKPGQEAVLAITLRRPFFERLLAASVSTSAEHTEKGACRDADAVLQWDPDHLPDGSKHPGRRAVQLGVRSTLRDEYIAGKHTLSIEDITRFVREMATRLLVQAGTGGTGSTSNSSSSSSNGNEQGSCRANPCQWGSLLVPAERAVQLSSELAAHVRADAWGGEAV